MHLSDTARELALRCEPQVNELARRMARDAFETLPGYAAFPGDMKDLEIAATARYGMRLFMRRVRDPQHRHGGNGVFRERAAQRAEEGVPLQLLLQTHSLGVHVLWQALREAVRPGEEAAFAELTDLLLRAHRSTVGAVAETYLDERAVLDAERREHRRSLARALFDGSLAGEPGQLAELGLAGEQPCLVMALSLEDSPGRSGPTAGHGSAVAARRVLRRLQSALDHAFSTEVAALLDGDAHVDGIGRAVVPGDPELPAGLLERLRRAGGDRMRVSAVRAEGPGSVPAAARTAAEVLRVARANGLPPGVHRMEDVLLEFHLSREDASSGPIAALLDPVGDRPELIETLRVHLEQDRQRRSTAGLLGLHPNTVDNRLARISRLTGLDLASPRGAALALAALQLRRDGGRDTASWPCR